MNLRLKKKQNTEVAIELWKTRQNLISQRKLNEKDVEKCNLSIATLLKDIFTPVAERTEMPINIEITETSTNISIPFTYISRTKVIKPTLNISVNSLMYMLSDKKELISVINDIETKIRFIKRSLKPQKAKGINCTKNHLTVYDPGLVKVWYTVRTRYF